MFSTVAVVFGHGLVELKVALRTFPIEYMLVFIVLLLVDISNPLFDTSQMHRQGAT